MLDRGKIRAITFDLDDTLWPVWPAIERAEKALLEWLAANAPLTAELFDNAAALREIRGEITTSRPDLKHDLSAMRLEAIRLALYRAGDDPALAQSAFDAFFEARQQVTLFEDALPALEYLAARYPLVSVSNGNADLQRIGLAHFFRASIHAREFGVGKPDPRIFHAAAGAVDLKPDDLLHIGDDATLDALGAMNAGMQAAWMNRADHLWPHEQQPHVTVATLTELCDLLKAS